MIDHPDAGRTPPEPGVPRWVKVAGVVVAALALFAVLVMLISGGEHGPGRHSGAPATLGAVL